FYSTFDAMVRADVHSVSLRHMTLPLLAFAIWFATTRPRPKAAGALLGLFAVSLVTNAIIAAALLLSLWAGDVAWKRRSPFAWLREEAPLWVTFALVCLVGYGATFAIPGSFSNVLGYHLGRPRSPLSLRLTMLRGLVPQNWPIFAWGI